MTPKITVRHSVTMTLNFGASKYPDSQVLNAFNYSITCIWPHHFYFGVTHNTNFWVRTFGQGQIYMLPPEW